MRTHLITISIVAALALAGCGDAEDTASDTANSASSEASEMTDSDDNDTDDASSDGSGSGESGGEDSDEASSGGDPAAAKEQRSEGFSEGGKDAKLIPVGTTVKADPEMVIFSFQGTGIPEYEVTYVDQAKDAASGKELDIAGEHIMQITLKGMNKEDASEAKSGRQDVTGDIVKDIYLGKVVDGTSVSFIGLDAQRPYQAIVNRSAPPGFVIQFTD